VGDANVSGRIPRGQIVDPWTDVLRNGAVRLLAAEPIANVLSKSPIFLSVKAKNVLAK
jgi:hypothetical protein